MLRGTQAALFSGSFATLSLFGCKQRTKCLAVPRFVPYLPCALISIHPVQHSARAKNSHVAKPFVADVAVVTTRERTAAPRAPPCPLRGAPRLIPLGVGVIPVWFFWGAGISRSLHRNAMWHRIEIDNMVTRTTALFTSCRQSRCSETRHSESHRRFGTSINVAQRAHMHVADACVYRGARQRFTHASAVHGCLGSWLP